jgi:adenylate cyclase
MLLILDDLQWSDMGSIGLLTHLANRVRGYRILLVGIYRTEDVAQGREDEPHPLTAIVDELRSAAENDMIDLGEADGDAFLHALMATEPNRLTHDFYTKVLARGQGHALFTVELVERLRETGGLTRDRDGYWVHEGDLSWQTWPAAVEALIARRIDSLPAHLRSLLAVASVEGERFSAEVAARILGIDLQEAVMQLSGELGRRRRLVRAQGVLRVNGKRISRYQFRHILFQQYLYHSLDAVERAYYHEQVGALLEEVYGAQEVRDAPNAQLALHFEAAGIPEKALHYRIRAGEVALAVAAYQEALVHFETGLGLLRQLPVSSQRAEAELSLRRGMATAFGALRGHGHQEAGEAYTRVLELSQTVAPGGDSFLALWGVWRYHHVRGEERIAEGVARQLIALADDSPDPVYIAGARHAMGVQHYVRGEFVDARRHLETAACVDPEAVSSSYTDLLGENTAVTTRFFLAIVLWLLGFPDESETVIRESVALASSGGHTFSEAFAHSGAASLYAYRGDAKQAQEEAAIAHTIAEKNEFDQLEAWSSFLGEWASNALRPDPTIVESIAFSRRACIEAGMVVYGTRLTAMLAHSHGAAGQPQRGLDLLEEALRDAGQRNEWQFEAEIYRLQGELRLMQEDAGCSESALVEAEDCYRKSIEVARRQQAKAFELRTTTSLCRLMRSQGRTGEALGMLSQILAWFPERFDTHDLADARGLLAEIRGG